MEDEIYPKEGIKLALEYYDILTLDLVHREDLTYEVYELIHEAFDVSLETRERHVLFFMYMYPYNIEDPVQGCVDVLGISEKTVYRHASKGIDKLHRYMNGWDE